MLKEQETYHPHRVTKWHPHQAENQSPVEESLGLPAASSSGMSFGQRLEGEPAMAGQSPWAEFTLSFLLCLPPCRLPLMFRRVDPISTLLRETSKEMWSPSLARASLGEKYS